jgi:hypothetical protein
MELCNQYDNCTAFSVEDNGVSHFAHGDPQQLIKPETQCRLYEETNVTSGDNTDRDCYIRWRKNVASPREIISSNVHIEREYNSLGAEAIAHMKAQQAEGPVMKMWESMLTERDEHDCISATQEWCEILGQCIESKTQRCLHEQTVLDTMNPERMACHMRNFEKAYQPPEGQEKFMYYTWKTGLSEAPNDSQYHTGGDDGFATKEESIAAAITFQFNDETVYRHPIKSGDNWFYCLLNHKCINMSTDQFSASDSVKIYNSNLGRLGSTKNISQLTEIMGSPAFMGNPDYFCVDAQTITLPWGGWDSVFLTKAMLDGHGCDRSKGESWCESSSSCLKKWAPENESACPGEEGLWAQIETERMAAIEAENNLVDQLKDAVYQGNFQFQ